jgi:hypothetical protein
VFSVYDQAETTVAALASNAVEDFMIDMRMIGIHQRTAVKAVVFILLHHNLIEPTSRHDHCRYAKQVPRGGTAVQAKPSRLEAFQRLGKAISPHTAARLGLMGKRGQYQVPLHVNAWCFQAVLADFGSHLQRGLSEP